MSEWTRAPVRASHAVWSAWSVATICTGLALSACTGAAEGDAGPANAIVVVHDEYFHPTSWRVTDVQATGGGTHTASQGAGEIGHTGFYRRMTHELPPSASITVMHELLGASYEPALRGALASMALDLDVALLPPPACSGGVTHRFVVFQGGEAFQAALPAITELAWTPVHLAALTAGSFRSASGHTPDFSVSGGAITFGFERGGSNATSAPVSVTHGLASLDIYLLRE